LDAHGVKPVPHLSFQTGRQTVLDETDALLLRRVSETGSISIAARRMGISYRNAWGRIKKLEASYGARIIETKVGGTAGGSAKLTPQGMALFKEFRHMRKYLFNAMDDTESAGNVRYKLSARNIVPVKVVGMDRGDITSSIKMESDSPVVFTSIISNEAVDDLDLKKGDRVLAIIKSTEVMVAKSDVKGAPPKRGVRRTRPSSL